MKDSWWQGTPTQTIKPGLERISALLAALGHPEQKFPAVHVAGTNGKGSTAAMIAAALSAQGLRVGLTTSPDLGQINQRVMINQVPVSPTIWDALGNAVERAGQGLPETPSFFEAITALAFLAFAQLAVDIAVVEVGLGGRWDATNTLPPPLVSVITPIAFDHMDRLGHTIQLIAGEKAGILKSPSPLVLAWQPFAEARETVLAKAADLAITVEEPRGEAWASGLGAFYETPRELVFTGLKGQYQTVNVATAWTVVEVLARLGWIADRDRARAAFADVRWPGRFEVVGQAPLVVLDGAHNLHAMAALRETLQSAPWNGYQWQLVMGALSDKPGPEMLRMLQPLVEDVWLTVIPGARQVPAEALPAWQPGAHVVAEAGHAVGQAIERARQREQGAVLVTGSLALLAHLHSLSPLPWLPASVSPTVFG